MKFKQEVLNILKKYKPELDEGFLQDAWKGHIGKMEYGQFESYLAYCLVREYRPLRIFEIGCASGFSSYPLAFATEKNEYGHLFSYEINDERCDECKTNMRRINLGCALFKGDARVIIKEQLREADLLMSYTKIDKQIDILFMDADHGKEFAQWYLKELVPITTKLLHVHDIYYGDPQMPEAIEVLAWLKQNPQYEWIKTKDITNEFGMDKILDNDPVGSKNSGIWVKL